VTLFESFIGVYKAVVSETVIVTFNKYTPLTARTLGVISLKKSVVFSYMTERIVHSQGETKLRVELSYI
jgi:hypothetical protein